MKKKNIPNKIKNLIFLKKKSPVPDFVFSNYKEYQKKKLTFIKKLKKRFKNKVIIRSAFRDEDRSNLTNAGKFLSVPNIDVKDAVNLDNSIKKVINSYKSKNIAEEFFIIQEMITNVKASGVVFAKNSSKGLPSVKINFSSEKKTDLITSGKKSGKIIFYIYEKKTNAVNKYKSIKEIHLKLNFLLKKFNPLDLEFCIDKKNKLYLLQIRNLNLTKNKFSKSQYLKSYKNFEKKLDKLINAPSILDGNFTIFSTMPDWNPAEMIGIKPNYLALSLYRTLITDDIWSKSRSNMGYKNLENTPLMYFFLGTPYIDLRAVFNSFIPRDLEDETAKKIIKYYLNSFKKKPEYFFDKVESNLLIHAFDFSINSKLQKFSKFLNKQDIKNFKEKILNLTTNIIKNFDKDIATYKRLNDQLKKLNNKKIYSFNKIYELIKICKNYGTLPFANLARSGFIGVGILNSMVENGIINQEMKSKFMQSIPSITTEMNNDLIRYKKNKFLKKYGHLRPNTYDINSENYHSGFNIYFDKKNLNIIKKNKYSFDKKIQKKIKTYLKKFNINLNEKELIRFILLSIEHREKSKFEFTKIIDQIFYEIKKIIKRFNIPPKNAKYINIFDILKIYTEFKYEKIESILKKNIEKNKYDFEMNNSIELPNNIVNSKDIYFFEEKINSPAFITNKYISGNFKFIGNKNFKENLSNAIVCIKNADPGFDFIFTKKIQGLITVYGGPNSHMAIRCSELNIPAAIGIGQQLFESIKNFNKIAIDASQKKIVLI